MVRLDIFEGDIVGFADRLVWGEGNWEKSTPGCLSGAAERMGLRFTEPGWPLEEQLWEGNNSPAFDMLCLRRFSDTSVDMLSRSGLDVVSIHKLSEYRWS